MDTYHRILLTRMKFIGDVVLTTPLIRSVRNAYPRAYIAYMGEKHAVSLIEHNPHVNDIIPFDFTRPAFLEQPRVAWDLRQRKFDLAIDLFGNPRSALLTFLSGAPTRVGPERKGRGKLYTIRVRDDGRPKTAIDFHNQYLKAAGIQPSARKTEIFLTDSERRVAKEYLSTLAWGREMLDLGKPLVGIHAGATWPAKRWMPESFAVLSDRIALHLGAQVVITAGPNDAESAQTVSDRTATKPPAITGPSLRLLAAVISHCAAYVSNDAGPMHLSTAVGTPTIGLFGPGEEDIWFPYSAAEGHVALRKDVPCHPCHLDVCNREGEGYMECMKLLTVDEVYEQVKERLMEKR